jgi:hypothetical protein
MPEPKISILNRKLTELPRYGLLYFGHVKGEYRVLATAITDPADREIISKILGREEDGSLRWQDVYTFELTLLKYRDACDLKSKLLTLRAHYRSVAGDKEFDAYLASETTTKAEEQSADVLRCDLRNLLDRFFLTYSFVSARERLRKLLLVWAAVLMFVLFVALAIIVGIAQTGADGSSALKLPFRINTLAVVIFAGIMGAFISMQQRIQSASVDGDVILTLSTLTHGWFGIFISPITGAIFAIILYLFFAGQLLSGSVFPKMMTPDSSGGCAIVTPSPTPSPTATPSATPTATASPSGSPSTSPAAAGQASPATATAAVSPTSTASPAVSPAAVASASPSPSASQAAVDLTTFLLCTGPASGVSYALLVIWCFIAGFAERFVPDALNRIVTIGEGERNMSLSPPPSAAPVAKPGAPAADQPPADDADTPPPADDVVTPPPPADDAVTPPPATPPPSTPEAPDEDANEEAGSGT